MDTPLVFFTVLSQLAVGLVVFFPGAFCSISVGETRADKRQQQRLSLIILAIFALAMLVSLLHLGHPLGAVRTLANIGSSWLSREILFFGLFGGVLFLALCSGNKVCIKLAAVIGIIAVGCSGVLYAPEAQMAMHNMLPLIFFLLTVIILGSSAYIYTASAKNQEALRLISLIALFSALVLYVALPSIWASGSVIMQKTASVWTASILYWARLLIGLSFPIMVLIKNNPMWNKSVFPLVIIGELLGRVLFFETVHSASNMGNLY